MAEPELIYYNDFCKVVMPDPADQDFRVYHSKLRILDDWQVQAGYKGATMINEVSEICPVLKLVLDVPGVMWAQVTAYQLNVRKASVFSWSEIDVHLIPLWDGIGIAIMHTDPDEIRMTKNLDPEFRKLEP